MRRRINTPRCNVSLNTDSFVSYALSSAIVGDPRPRQIRLENNAPSPENEAL